MPQQAKKAPQARKTPQARKKQATGKKTKTDISIVLDRSGSMAAIKNDTIGGFNTFIAAQQKVDGEGWLTMVQFDTEYEFIHNAVPLGAVPPLDDTTFVPRGATALLDAVGRTIEYVGARIGKMQKTHRPDQVLFVIITDGEENSSREFKLEQIHKMISQRQEKEEWQFVFIGANQDAIQAGAQLGIPAGAAFSFEADGEGVENMFQRVSGSTVAYREEGYSKSSGGFFK